MKNWTVRTQIILGFSAVILIMVLLSIFALTHLQTIATRTDSLLQDVLPGMDVLGEIRSSSQEQYSLLHKYLASASAEQKAQLALQSETTEKKLDEAFARYEPTVYLSEERRLMDQTRAARMRFSAAAATVLKGGAASADTSGQNADATFQAYSQALDQLSSFNQELGDRAAREIYGAEESTMVGILVALGLGLLFSIACGYVLIRAINTPLKRVVSGMEVMSRGDFSQPVQLDGRGEFGILSERLNHMATDLTALFGSVKDSGIRVDTSATEIAATAQEQLAAANEVAATTAEVGATSKEISATAKELMQTVKGVTAVAEETAALASSGQSGLARMQATMQQIVEASASINAKLGILSEKAGSIGAVITTITKVADQTNLLSLNAAIEAEKAGEYGRGFSVVATEIRRLADQTALATTDIERMVQEIQSAVSAGVMGMDKFSEEVRRGVDVVQHVSGELNQIIHQVQNLTASFETVSDGMQSQAAGAQQISEALSQLTEASRQTVESLRQSNLAIEQLNSASRTMQQGVQRFTLAA